ncbi:MAG TPA: hypothetical protein ENJ95_02835 [Bacteroidetes bacterium]|nr:hypothetical protein [Bacteroidota bacterium]
MKKTITGILGIGAIGSALAAALYKNKNIELKYYNRSPRDFIKIKIAGAEYIYPIDCQTNIAAGQQLDWLIICLKEYHFENAKEWLGKLIGASTKVAVIRNGLRLKEPVLEFCEEKNIVECMVDCPVQPVGDGFYEQYKMPKITIPKSGISAPFLQLFDKKYISVNIVADFKTAAWEKLCGSAALGAILCLSGETCWIFNDKKIREIYKNILTEAVEVAIADGAIIPGNFIGKMLARLKEYPPEKGSSMLTDRRNGRPVELGAKNGAISRLGALYGIKTPLNDLACSLLQYTNKDGLGRQKK